MKTPPAKRSYSKVPVWIVEDHHEVVQHIYRAIASRHIPMKNVKMVHLDSHPDLLIPVSLAAHTVFDIDTLFSELSIENWIMPMVYAGHVSHVAWLHPYWAQQIQEGKHEMYVGRDMATNTIRVTSTDSYFLSDALYVPAEQLEDKKPLHLSVIRVDPVNMPDRIQDNQKQNMVKKSKLDLQPGSSGSCSGVSQPEDGSSGSCRVVTQPEDGSSGSCSSISKPEDCSSGSCYGVSQPTGGRSTSETLTAEEATASVVGSLLSVLKQDEPYILDIDLDFFSCKNPFKEMYTQEEYSILQELYGFERPREDADEEALCECVERRTRQLEDLEVVFADLLEDDGELTVERLADKPGMKSLVKLVCSLKSRNESPDYEMVHQAGLTCDYSELPHHISSEAEIQQLMLAVHFILQRLPKPTLITMSRSSMDEYCPGDQVDFIQSSIMNLLETLFGSLDVHEEYREEESVSEEVLHKMHPRPHDECSAAE